MRVRVGAATLFRIYIGNQLCGFWSCYVVSMRGTGRTGPKSRAFLSDDAMDAIIALSPKQLHLLTLSPAQVIHDVETGLCQSRYCRPERRALRYSVITSPEPPLEHRQTLSELCKNLYRTCLKRKSLLQYSLKS